MTTGLIFGLDAKATMQRFIWPNDIAARLRLERSRYVKAAGDATLFILARAGFGKTHLLQAIAFDERDRLTDADVVYVSAKTWNRRVKNRGVGSLPQALIQADLLLLDDAGDMQNKEEISAIVATRAKARKRTIIAVSDRQAVLRAGLGALFNPTQVIEFKRLSAGQVRRLIAQKANDFGVEISSKQEKRLATYCYRDVIDVISVVEHEAVPGAPRAQVQA